MTPEIKVLQMLNYLSGYWGKTHRGKLQYGMFSHYKMLTQKEGYSGNILSALRTD